MDYLWMHAPLIGKESYIEEEFSVPATIEELASLLPGNTQYDDLDDLLMTIGKQSDRTILHNFVSKLFKVPQRVLLEAEKDRGTLLPKKVLEAVNKNRKKAKEAADAVAAALSNSNVEDNIAKQSWPTPSEAIDKTLKKVFSGPVEYADPEHICTDCLPIYGDDIVGTRPEDKYGVMPKVHRLGCPHAQRAINRVLAENNRVSKSDLRFDFKDRIDSVKLRRSVRNPALLKQTPAVVEVPVHLQWAEFPGPGEAEISFPCEVVVHAEDRKLLLADCSEVVSELSEIVKTGSQTTNEHATLVFLIQVRGISELQQLMDSLQQIRSVMAVERRVSLHCDRRMQPSWFDAFVSNLALPVWSRTFGTSFLRCKYPNYIFVQ